MFAHCSIMLNYHVKLQHNWFTKIRECCTQILVCLRSNICDFFVVNVIGSLDCGIELVSVLQDSNNMLHMNMHICYLFCKFYFFDSCCFPFVKASMISFSLQSDTSSMLGLPLLHLLVPVCQENQSAGLVLHQILFHPSTLIQRKSFLWR